MRNTIRIVLAVFLIVLVGANYNSVRIVNLAVSFLNESLQQRASFLVREFTIKLSEDYPEIGADSKRLDDQLQKWMSIYNVQGIFVFSGSDKAERVITDDIPQDLVKAAASLSPNKNIVSDKYMLAAGEFVYSNAVRKVVLAFDVGNYLRFERSAKVISYSGLLLMILAGIAMLYFFESAIRPYRILMQTARSAPASLPKGENRNEADFLIQTFDSVIAQLKTKEQELAKLHLIEKARADDVAQLNQDLIRSISSGLILVDQAGKITVFNEVAEGILKVSGREVVGRNYGQAMESFPAFKSDMERCFSERSNINRAELEIHTPDSELRYLGAGIMPLQDRQQNFAGIICLFTDITEFKLLQKHMAEKEKYASLGEMAGGVAHEFRNSVATISGYMQLLENKIDEDRKEYTTPIQQELQSLQKVVNDFLSFARPVELEMATISLRDLLQECADEVRVAANADLEFKIHGIFPNVRGDERMLRQVFTNLIRNAAESLEGLQRKGKLEISGSTAPSGKLCVVDIVDNGCGIPDDDVARIFTPFFSTKKEGVGLGLAIVQKLVLQHNGTISVESSPEGSLFRVQLRVG